MATRPTQRESTGSWARCPNDTRKTCLAVAVGDTFPALVAARLKSLRLTQRQLAARLGLGAPQVSRILRGKRCVPADQADRWIAALSLSGADAQRALLLLHLCACPPMVRAYVRRLEAQAASGAEVEKRCQWKIDRAMALLSGMSDPTVKRG